MGIFDKVKKGAPTPEAEPVIEYSEVVDEVTANLTDKMIRVELEDGEDDGYIRYAEVKQKGERIQIVSGRIVIAEVSKRGKAYKELEPYVGKTAESMTIRRKTGDYGEYYRVRLRFKTNTATITY